MSHGDLIAHSSAENAENAQAHSPKRRLILVATDRTDDLLPICRRFNSVRAPVMANLQICHVSSASEALQSLRDEENDVAVLIFRPSLLEAADGGAELTLMPVGDKRPVRLDFGPHDAALDVASDTAFHGTGTVSRAERRELRGRR